MGFIAWSENGTYIPEFDVLDNDYIDVFTSYWDSGMNAEESRDWVYLREGPRLKQCSMDKVEDIVGKSNGYWRQSSVCLEDMNDATIIGDLNAGYHRELNFHIAACDSKKRSTCKSREETAAFLGRSIFFSYSFYSVVVED